MSYTGRRERVPFNAAKAYVYRGGGAWGRDGVAVSQMGPLPVTRYTGEYFDNNVAVLTVDKEDHLPAVWCFCESERFASGVREFDQKLNVTNANLVQVPFDLAHWQSIAATEYPQGLPEPYSDDPTQWLFHGHPCGAVVWDEETKWTAHSPLRADASVLQVAVARLLGYRWPAELDPDMRLAAESKEWVERCRELHGFADADGIVCLQAAAGELPAADRLRHLLAAAYGEEWSAAKEQELLAAAADGKSPVRPLDDWLHDRFFAEHCKLFHNRPFIWHIWDGRSDGFHALVNYHRLCGPDGEGRRTLEALAYRHLGEWIDRQRAAQSQGEEGADRDFVPDVVLGDGDVVDGAGWRVAAVHTPGHTSNHLCFALDGERTLFSGDHVMGWSTSVIAPPDGDMAAYRASLARLLERDDRVYWPTHGPAIDAPERHVRAFLDHRAARERQVLACLADGVTMIADMVAPMYPDLAAGLWPAARRSVLAHLIELVDRGVVVSDGAPEEDVAFEIVDGSGV